MANPRNTVKFDGIEEAFVTMLADGTDIAYSASQPNGSAVVGRAVTLVGSTSDKTVRLAGDGDVIYGKLIKVEGDGKCVIQKRGYCTFPGGDSATLTLGTKIVGDLNASSARGFVQTLSETVSASPSQAEVQNVLKAAKTRGIIIDNDDTTAVVVDLG